uniref:MBOAT family protein n=1 Tax=Toxocara canis TaxID=6265 RepID=A0A183UX36_TOXCA
LAPDAGQQQGLGRYAIGYAALALAFFVRDWFRLHGQKLSRLLKPLINVSQLMVTWNFFPWFDIFASEKETIAGKYLFNADGPVLNEDNPRTPNKRFVKRPVFFIIHHILSAFASKDGGLKVSLLRR